MTSYNVWLWKYYCRARIKVFYWYNNWTNFQTRSYIWKWTVNSTLLYQYKLQVHIVILNRAFQLYTFWRHNNRISREDNRCYCNCVIQYTVQNQFLWHFYPGLDWGLHVFPSFHYIHHYIYSSKHHFYQFHTVKIVVNIEGTLFIPVSEVEGVHSRAILCVLPDNWILKIGN